MNVGVQGRQFSGSTRSGDRLGVDTTLKHSYVFEAAKRKRKR